jgi:hypothetical protein
MVVKIHALLTLEHDRGQWSILKMLTDYLEEKAHGTHCV